MTNDCDHKKQSENIRDKRVHTLDMRSCVHNLSQNPGAEIVRYGRRKKDILSLGQGEGDKPTPDFIMQAAQKALYEGRTFYGAVLGHDILRDEIATYYKNIYGLDITQNRVFVTNSGSNAMHLALTALLDEGDEVVAVTPIWKNLLGAVELAQADFVEVPLDFNHQQKDNGGWSLDLDRLFDACTDKTRIILITTPSNPTGWVMSEEEMRAVLEFARARGMWIVSDEVYGRLAYGMKCAPSFLDVAAPDDRLFTVNSFSKAWAMTGWRLGWLVGPPQSEECIRDIALYDHMGPPAFTQYGGIEALRHGENFIQEQMSLWQGNRDFVHEFFEQTGRINSVPSGATFYSFFKVDGEPDCLDFAKRLIDDVSLSLAPGCAFGQVGRGYMRLCYAVSRPRLEEALERMQRALKG